MARAVLYYPISIDDLLDLGAGDPRWSGSSALIGASISGQTSIAQYLVDNGAKVDMKAAVQLPATVHLQRSLFRGRNAR